MTSTKIKLDINLEDPYQRAKELKKQGIKVFGVSPMHFPEELLHAGGVLPIVLQESNEPVTYGMAHLYPFFCGFTRSVVDMGVRNKLDFMDAIVVGDMCIQIRHMAKTLKRQMPATSFVYLQWPLEISERFHSTVRERLTRCKQTLEALLGRKITDDNLTQSIALYNKNRVLLRRVFELSRAKTGILRARDLVTLVQSSMVTPKEENNQMLEQLIVDLEKKKAPPAKAVRIYLAGHLCMAVKAEILDLIEELGGQVVWDDLYTGYRYIASDASEKIAPLEALTQRYFNLGIPCPTRMEPKLGWSDYVLTKVQESNAQGVMVLMVKQCGPMLLYYPFLKDVLTKAGIPQTLIVTEHEIISLEQIKTRIQAFIEMIKKGA